MDITFVFPRLGMYEKKRPGSSQPFLQIEVGIAADLQLVFRLEDYLVLA